MWFKIQFSKNFRDKKRFTNLETDPYEKTVLNKSFLVVNIFIII